MGAKGAYDVGTGKSENKLLKERSSRQEILRTKELISLRQQQRLLCYGISTHVKLNKQMMQYTHIEIPAALLMLETDLALPSSPSRSSSVASGKDSDLLEALWGQGAFTLTVVDSQVRNEHHGKA